MAENKRGGARPGSGRKATGSNTKHYTVNLALEEAEMLEKQAAEKDMKVNKYLRELIRIGVMYENVNVEGLHVDEPKKEKDTDLRKKPVASYSLDSFDQLPMAAEEVKPYDRSN